MSLKSTFEKQGGTKLLKQYWKGGAFFTAACQFLLLGKSRTALELLRLSATLKTKQKLERKYRKDLEAFDANWTEREHNSSNRIWICWFQGMDAAPELVQQCYRSVVLHNPDKEVIVITSDNYKDYVTFPDYIIEKWEKGIITHTHMTDLLRLELLVTLGGMWIDATVLCTSDDIPHYFFDSELFFYQTLKPGRDGHPSYISSWLMSAKTNNKILSATRELCYKYWQTNNTMWDYFLLHDFISIVMDKYVEDWKRIIPRDNATPHELLLRLFEPFNQEMWDAIRVQTPFHKLTYKFSEEQKNKPGTFYDELFGADGRQ